MTTEMNDSSFSPSKRRPSNLPLETTFSPSSDRSYTIQRPLSPSCLTTLHSCDPIEYITSPDHKRKSTDTLGEARSDHFDRSTLDSFDQKFLMDDADSSPDSKSRRDGVDNNEDEEDYWTADMDTASLGSSPCKKIIGESLNYGATNVVFLVGI